MGYGWSQFCNDLHEDGENEQDAAYRLGRTPPEMWTGRDITLARHLRYRREMALNKATKEGTSISRALVRYPEGPFWPAPLQNVGIRRDNYIKLREQEEINNRLVQYQGQLGQHGHYGHHGNHGHGQNHGYHGHLGHANHGNHFHNGHEGHEGHRGHQGNQEHHGYHGHHGHHENHGGGMQAGWRNGRRNHIEEWNELLG